MEIIGTPSIRPGLFYSGKGTGYILWIMFNLSILPGFSVLRTTTGMITGLACVLFAIGVLVCIAAMSVLGRSTRFGLPAGTTPLRTGGLYRISRNPIYIGFHVMTAASLLGLGRLYLVLPGLYTSFIYHRIILAEERFLMEAHGIAFVEYCRRVRRYL